MWISALVTFLNLGLAAAIGLRLLWRARLGERGPEGWLAGYFLCGAFVGSLLNIAVYSSLGEGGLDLSPALASRLVAAATLANAVAGSCIYAFTWRTFRRGEAWAGALVAVGVAAFAGTWLFQAATGGFVVKPVPGFAYWAERVVFFGGFLWASLEAFRYHGTLRRRQSIGLSEPVVVDRFWLWGLWAATNCAQATSEVCARIAYYWRVGRTDVLIVDEAMPIIVFTIAITAVVGIIAAAALWLTFFPTRGYRDWVERRAAPA